MRVGRLGLGLFGRRRGGGGFAPITGAQSLGVQIAARAFAPIVGSQSVTAAVAARAFAPIQGGQSIGVTIGAEESGAGPDILDLLTTFPSRTVQYLYVGDLGYSSAAGTTTWADQSAQARNLTVADATAPVRTQYAGINNRYALLGNGVDQYIQSTAFNRGANWWYLFVFMPVSWTAGDHLMGSTSTASRQAIAQNPTSSPNLRLQGTANGSTNAGATTNNWHRVRARFAGGTAAFLRVGSTNATGVDPGTAASSGVRFLAGGTATPAGYGNMALALALALDDAPTGPEESAADTIITSYYGGSVAVG